MPLAHWSSSPHEREFNLDFRPSSYVAEWCATAAAVQNIVGEERRERVHQRLVAAGLRPPCPSDCWRII